MIDHRTAPAPATEGEPEFETVERHIRTAARTALRGETAEQRIAAADALVLAIEHLPPTMPVARKSALLRSLLDDPEIPQRKGGDGVEVRARLVTVQMALGFPHALEVNPDQLAAMRTPLAWNARSIGSRALTMAMGLCTIGWSAMAAYAAMISSKFDDGTDTEPGPGVGTWLLLAQAMYGVASTVLPTSRRLAEWLGGKNAVRTFGWVGIGSPLAAFVLGALAGVDTGWALVLGLPSTLIGLACLRIASTMDD